MRNLTYFLKRLSATEKKVNFHGRSSRFPARLAMTVDRERHILWQDGNAYFIGVIGVETCQSNLLLPLQSRLKGEAPFIVISERSLEFI